MPRLKYAINFNILVVSCLSALVFQSCVWNFFSCQMQFEMEFDLMLLQCFDSNSYFEVLALGATLLAVWKHGHGWRLDNHQG